MRINTFTVVAGTASCDAKCPYCISKQTGTKGFKHQAINARNFDIACRLAEKSGATTMLITGKGEPMLSIPEVHDYCIMGKEYFPLIELQTNGREISLLYGLNDYAMEHLYSAGLTTVSISIAHHDIIRNNEIFRFSEYHDFWETSKKLKGTGFTVRLNCTMTRGLVDSSEEVEKLVDRCRKDGIDQLTIRPVTVFNGDDSSPSIVKWTNDHILFDSNLQDIKLWFEKNGTHLLDLPHGGRVYDVGGQNVCLGNCLTSTTDTENIRQFIYFPDGHLRYDWKYKGAIIF